MLIVSHSLLTFPFQLGIINPCVLFWIMDMESDAMDANLAPIAPSNINEVKPKMHFIGKVVKTALSGALVDIGLENPGMIHISQLKKEPVKRVEEVVQEGQEVEVWVRRVAPKKGRVELTMIEPLGLEWNEIKKDMVVTGTVTRLEKFGAFVDIGAERPGLVHISEMTHDYVRTPGEVVKEGDKVEVKVLDVIKQKKQIKLSMKALIDKPEEVVKAVLNKAEKKETREKVREKETEAPAEEKEVAIPTAMEMALRDAMEKKGVDSVGDLTGRKKRKGGSSKELEGIYTRTLKNRTK
jgi:small subunit ribosomal protein S1